MHLPENLRTKLEGLTEGLSLKEMAKENAALSSHYREDRAGKATLSVLGSQEQRLAYLLTRLPATYAAITHVLEKISEKESVISLLDVGAGPGTALLAAAEIFPSLERAVLLERDREFVRLGKQLTEDLSGITQEWICEDLAESKVLPVSGLVIASYSLGELGEGERLNVLERLWAVTGQFLVLIEPGTPFGFSQIRQMRDFLISKKASLLLPCPHEGPCPMAGGDWCHFSARIERTSAHRKIKDATLNYEDEKFSYVVFSKQSIPRGEARVIRRPIQGSGFVKLQVCSTSGLEEKIVSKKNKERFRYAKKIKWGDEF